MVDIWGAEDIEELDSSVVDEADADKDLLKGLILQDEGISQNDIDALFDWREDSSGDLQIKTMRFLASSGI